MHGLIRIAATIYISLLCMIPSAIMAQQATTREYPYLYKSTRAMGMGGAYTAVGGRVDSLFYNPAGLINIPQDKGWEVNLINVSAEYGKRVQDFVNDMQDANDTGDLNHDGKTGDDQTQAVNDVLARYRGGNLHMRVADFTSIGKSYDKWAFGLGGIASGRLDAMTHQGFGSDGFLEVNADAIYGALVGASIGVSDNVFAGFTLKSLKRESLIHNFSAREIVDKQDNLGDYIKDDLRTSGSGVGLDLGVIWKFAPDSPLKPTFGASIMNLGDLKFGGAGKLPQTINLGIAINPALSWARSLTVAADYVDLLNNFKQDKDMVKRLRLGAELQIFDIWPVEFALRAGVYEYSPTYGFDLRLLFITLSYVNYTEEIGAYAGQDKDRRQLATLNIGW